MSYDRLNENDVAIGKELPYSVYDAQGNLLLAKGHVISSPNQLNVLMSRGMYRQAQNEPMQEKPREVRENPFVRLSLIGQRLTGLHKALAEGKQEGVTGIQRLAGDIQRVCEEEPDAMLAAVHLFSEGCYTTYHALHRTILCEVVGDNAGHSAEQRLSMMAAALTANIAILELQNKLNDQTSPLTAQQKERLRSCPVESVRMLNEAGADDPLWLDVVLQYHERINGEGYPAGLKGDEIIGAARLLSVADRYTAMVSARSYRKPMMSFHALREFLVTRGSEYDENLSLLLIKELGIYPPGTFVKLVNGETAVITKRSQKRSMQPFASSFISPRGGLFANPLRRDCSHSDHAIKEVCGLDSNIKLNIYSFWANN